MRFPSRSGETPSGDFPASVMLACVAKDPSAVARNGCRAFRQLNRFVAHPYPQPSGGYVRATISGAHPQRISCSP